MRAERSWITRCAGVDLRSSGNGPRSGLRAQPDVAASFWRWRSFSSAAALGGFALDSANADRAEQKIPPETFTSAARGAARRRRRSAERRRAILGAGADLRRRGRRVAGATGSSASIYARGEVVPRNDVLAYKYFEQLVESYNEDDTDRRDLGAIANAFVAVGLYSLNGIADSEIKPDPERALEMFQVAATDFGDPGRAIPSRAACTWKARPGWRATTCAPRAGSRSPPRKAIRRAGAARPHAVQRRRRAAPARARPDVADAAKRGAGPEGRLDPRAIGQGFGRRERRRPRRSPPPFSRARQGRARRRRRRRTPSRADSSPGSSSCRACCGRSPHGAAEFRSSDAEPPPQ